MQHSHLDNFVGLVSREKLSGGGRHVGVLLPDGQVAHKTSSDTVIVSIEEFGQGRQIKLDKPAPIESHWALQWRAHESISHPQPYDLLNKNCEHYATDLLGEKPQSQQVNALMLFALIGTVIWLMQ